MATATKKNIKDTLLELNKKSLNAVEDLIEGSINTGERWQKLYSQAIKKAQPVISEQIDLTFKTAEGVIEQYESAVDRFKDLFEEKKATEASTKNAKTTGKKASEKKAKIVSLHTDLTVINGIGPKLAETLNKIGISSLEELAVKNPAQLADQIAAINSRYAMHNPADWISEAKAIITK